MSAGLLIPLTSFHCKTSIVSSISAARLAENNSCLRWELCIYRETVVVSDKNCNYINPFHVCWISVLLSSLSWLPLAIPIGALKYVSSEPHNSWQTLSLMTNAKYVSWQTLSQLCMLLVVNVYRPLATSCLQMRQQTHEVWFYPNLFLSIFHWCLFQLKMKVYFHLKIFFVTRLPLVQIIFRSCLMRTL